jgi:tetratricopeptide (TPR) repeat protein
MIMLLGSYFFDEDTSVFFSSFFHRIKDKTYQHRAFFYVPGNRIPQTKLYILVSKNTFSAAEGFAYDFKYLKRATIVGEKTMGAAHVANLFIVNEYFLINLPFAVPVNSITNSNWECTGVEPDIPCKAEEAVDAVYKNELDRIANSYTDEASINALGYELLLEKQYGAAIEIFLKNVKLFPNSANTYDSLGEAYMNTGNKELAIENYKKSLELDPNNDNAKKMIEQLQK